MYGRIAGSRRFIFRQLSDDLAYLLSSTVKQQWSDLSPVITVPRSLMLGVRPFSRLATSNILFYDPLTSKSSLKVSRG